MGLLEVEPPKDTLMGKLFKLGYKLFKGDRNAPSGRTSLEEDSGDIPKGKKDKNANRDKNQSSSQEGTDSQEDKTKNPKRDNDKKDKNKNKMSSEEETSSTTEMSSTTLKTKDKMKMKSASAEKRNKNSSEVIVQLYSFLHDFIEYSQQLMAYAAYKIKGSYSGKQWSVFWLSSFQVGNDHYQEQLTLSLYEILLHFYYLFV